MVLKKDSGQSTKVRVDKWLWAARFFKTRAKAKQAIEGGKVHLGTQRTRPSKELAEGDILRIRQGYDDKIVRVIALSDQRRGATDAALLYEETPESLEARKLSAEQRRAAGKLLVSENRPGKKDRRLIHKFRQRLFSDSD